jgi:hypothetical protein
VVGRIEDASLEVKFGYKTLWRPSISCLTVIYAGLGDISRRCAESLISEFLCSLANGEAEVVRLKDLRSDSYIYSAVAKDCGFSFRDHFFDSSEHWKARLGTS